MISTRADALTALQHLTGVEGAQFHDGQLEAITALVDDRRRALVVQRTGWGKSAVYFIATSLLRSRGAGPTLLVSPLLALMRDQVAAAGRAGVRAVAINSTNPHEWEQTRAALEADEVDILLVSPERLNNPRFRDEQLPTLLDRMGLLVVDEAHCISDWGHDFRPDYRRLAELIDRLPADLPVLATTATANERVVTDVAEQLGAGDVLTIRGSLARDSLRLGVLELPSTRARLGWLVAHLADLPGSGIIYALTVSAAEDTARLLRDAGLAVRAYTGRTDTEERADLERQLKDNEVKALVATSALGMGFDKPDLGFVVHLGAPSSPVAYYQQVGRAGRATDHADVLLLPGREDQDIWTYFATASMPSEERAAAVIGELSAGLGHDGQAAPLSTPALEARVNIRRTPLELLLKVLDVDGAVRRVQGGWVATGQPWTYDRERYERIAQARTLEQQALIDYEHTGACRMELLQRDLDDDSARPCGRCDTCTQPWYPTEVPQIADSAATATLAQVGVAIDSRAQWPTGSQVAKGKIAVDERAEEGRAVARLTDLGWGGTLREVFAAGAPDAPVSDALLGACVQVLKDWSWSERPVAVVSMPSRSRSQLVDSLGRGLARIGRLQDLGSLDPVGEGARHGSGGNSVYRLADVWGTVGVGPQLAGRLGEVGPGPILLVDDRVDSRWTITVAARELRRHGAGPVLPFALAVVG